MAIFRYVMTLWLLLLANIVTAAPLGDKAVTYGTVDGRLGDALVAYMRAKWLSYRYGIPLLYRPFPYSDQLKLHTKELSYEKYLPYFQIEQHIRELADIERPVEQPTLFVLPYFSESLVEYRDFEYFQKCSWFPVNWESRAFRKLLARCIAPRKRLHIIKPPEDRFSVALHVRLGCGFDPPEALRMWPLKFPPLCWYRDQLLYIKKLCGKRKIYVHIFTDDPNPAGLAEYFRVAVRSKRIKFDYRRCCNAHNANVLEDLFSMAQFDCLIRPMSNLSFVSGVIGKAKLMIYPTSYSRVCDNNYIIDHTHVVRRQYLGSKLKK
jgi:hypothetical protein